MNDDRNRAKVDQAKADLRRLDEQSEKLLSGQYAGGDERDPAELWGKRIGRGLGFAFALYLIWHLLSTYVFKT